MIVTTVGVAAVLDTWTVEAGPAELLTLVVATWLSTPETTAVPERATLVRAALVLATLVLATLDA